MDHMHMLFNGKPIFPGSLDGYIPMVKAAALHAAYNAGFLPYPMIWVDDHWEQGDPTSCI